MNLSPYIGYDGESSYSCVLGPVVRGFGFFGKHAFEILEASHGLGIMAVSM